MPGERHLQEILKRLWGEGNTGPTATRKDGYVLGLPLCRHCIRLDCAPEAPPRFSLRLSPLEARRVGAPRRVGARASRRRTERRGSTAQRAIPPPLLDLGHRPVGWGTRRHLRRHAVVRRESPRCQTSCAPDGHAWGVVAPRGVPARGGCGGGLVGSQEDCALLASWPGPLWRPEAAMRLLWRDWRQALPASGTAWVVRRVLRLSTPCVLLLTI